jgi:uncharacterized membrane protein YeaQ/YmgE (transglycosylase-associated protein family)
MDLVPLLIIGFVAGMVTGAVIGGPATGYLASTVVGILGAFLGAFVNGLLGISTPGDTVGVIVLAIVGSAAVRLAMQAVSRRSAPRPG